MDPTAPTAVGTVYPWHCDHMGHMNVMHYVGRFDEATWQLFHRLGLTPAWLREHGRGMAAVEQHLRYQRELLPGDVFEIRSRVLAVSAKSMRFAHEMRRAGEETVAATCELTGVHLDTRARRAVAFDEAIAARIAAAIGPAA
jgi:acyl-CoA thioester hydrolase